MDVRWQYGVFLGRALHTDQNFIGIHDGSVVTARAMVRLVTSARWDWNRIERVTGTPADADLQIDDEAIEGTEAPHAHEEPDAVEEDEDLTDAHRRLKITLKDLKEHGYSKLCPKCRWYEQDNAARAKKAKHSESCRARIYKALKEAGAAKMREVEEANPERLKARDAEDGPKGPKKLVK